MFDGHVGHLLLAILLAWLIMMSRPQRNGPYTPWACDTDIMDNTSTPHSGWGCSGLKDEYIGFASNTTIRMVDVPRNGKKVTEWRNGLRELEIYLQGSQPCYACVSDRVTMVKCPYGNHVDYSPVCDADIHTDIDTADGWTPLGGTRAHVKINDDPVVYSEVRGVDRIYIAVYTSGSDLTAIRLEIEVRDLRPCNAYVRGDNMLHIECLRETLGRMDLYLYGV